MGRIHQTKMLVVVVMCLALPVIGRADGALDPGFGVGGIVTSNFAVQDELFAAAVQADNKLVVVGSSGGNIAVARYNSNGSIDTTFGALGLATGPVGEARGVAMLPGGKILVAASGSNKFMALRYLPNGFLDPTFGTAGMVQTPLVGAFVIGMAIQSDDKFLVGGRSDSGVPSALYTVVRYLPDGTLDTSYGTAGVATVDPSGSNAGGYMSGMVLVAGKVVCAGESHPGGDYLVTLARLDATGALDTAFGIGGVVRTNVAVGPEADVAYGVAAQVDQKLVVAGTAPGGGGSDTLLMRYDANGALDATFGTGGVVIQALSASGDQARGVLVQPDGKIVTAGFDGDFLMARFSSNGALDASFGTAGVVSTPIAGFDMANSVLIPTAGRLLLVGSTDPGAGKDFALAQYAATTPVELESFSIR